MMDLGDSPGSRSSSAGAAAAHGGGGHWLFRTIPRTDSKANLMGILSSEDDAKLTTGGEFTSIVVVGATGDLSHRKIFPALFSLFVEKHFPKNYAVVGYARSSMTLDQFKEKSCKRLACRAKAGAACESDREDFVKNIHYFSGQYDSLASFQALDNFLAELERGFSPVATHNRLFYFSIPPSVFLATARGIAHAAMARTGWTRVIIEKPFGKDSESSLELSTGLARLFPEEAIYRIDHYLGKEVVQNLMVLRFANLIFEPLWNRQSVASVTITFKEELGVEGRGGYFDEYGIIRDVMQNHLLQIMALIAMEPPVSLDAEDVRDEKVKVLRSCLPIRNDDLVVGQYVGDGTAQRPGYREDATVPKDSITPTYAAAVVRVNNRRWEGVPFFLVCGKAMDARLAEIRIQFQQVPGFLFRDTPGGMNIARNELVIRVQPDEAIFMSVVNKVPGLKTRLESKELDLEYKARFSAADIPDAYERLILDVLHGDKSLFIRSDELEAAWDIFTPALHHLEKHHVRPHPYVWGSRGPAEADALAARHNVRPTGASAARL
eukprot:tig00021579_g22444.t1